MSDIHMIPIELDLVSAPIRVVAESQKLYGVLSTYLAQVIAEYNETGVMSRDFFKITKEMREILKFVKEITLDTQVTYEQQAAQILAEIAKEDPDIRKKLGDRAARVYLEKREEIRDALADP